MQRLRLLAACMVAVVCLLDLGMCEAHAQRIPRRHHVWGRFRPGSWKLVRMVTETMNPNREVMRTSTTDTLTTLQSVDADEVTLKVEATVEVGGKRLDGVPQELTQSLLGELAGQNATVTDAGTGVVEIQDQRYSCRVLQLEVVTAKSKTVVKTWYSDEVAPYVLRRHSTTTDLESGQTTGETTMEVVSLGVRRKVRLQRRTTAEIKVVHRHDRGLMVTRTWNCVDVPGGIVSQFAEEFDRRGQLLRRSRLELVDFSEK